MKKLIVFFVIIVVGVFLLFNYNSAPNNVEIATISETKSIENNDLNEVSYQDFDASKYNYKITDFNYQFTGYGPGKSHLGKIDKEISDNGEFVNFDMTTVDTGIKVLDDHLCSDDFFNCTEYPNSKFTIISVNPNSENTARVTGIYEMKGISKNISFVADVVEGGKNLSNDNLSANYEGRFMLDTSEFNFKVPIVDNNVLIEFDVTVKALPIEKLESSGENTNSTTTIE